MLNVTSAILIQRLRFSFGQYEISACASGLVVARIREHVSERKASCFEKKKRI